MNPNSTLTLSSRCVVPARHHSAEKGKVAGTIVQQIFRNLAVIVNLSVKIVEDRKSRPIALRQVAVMRREFHGRIHAKQPGILKIECLPRRGHLVHRLANNGDVVAFKMGRRQGGPSRTGAKGRVPL
jgi:hypothetical protein